MPDLVLVLPIEVTVEKEDLLIDVEYPSLSVEMTIEE